MMQMLTSLMLFVVACLLVAYTILAEGTDWIGRAEIIEKRWPKIWAVMSNRPMRLVLVAVALGMLAHIAHEFEKGDDPPVTRFVAPAVPSIEANGPKPESPTSLRRRTMRLADEMFAYIRARVEGHPPYAYPDSSNPNPSEDRKKQIQVCREYDQVTFDYYNRHFKERLIGIVREYHSKGVKTGFLEAAAQNGILTFPMPGSGIEGTPSDEMFQFRNLAYHVDAYDNLIVINPEN